MIQPKSNVEIPVKLDKTIVKAFNKELNYFKIYHDLITPRMAVPNFMLGPDEPAPEPRKPNPFIKLFNKLRVKIAWFIGGKLLDDFYEDLDEDD